jgi:phosphatidylethanolamine/phosphatidyl-N-methylethanolamine N-methyltransferase
MPHSGAAEAQASAKILNEAAYSRWAPVYDLVFDLPFHPGRLAATRAAVAAAGANGSVLVVGVGTGLELELTPSSVRVTGIDISAPMLDIARERVARKALRQVKGLHVMDAGAMEFPDAQFDAALAPYVMSVVPNPARVLSEMWRVVRPGGQMIVMNHFAARGGPRALIEAAMEKASGWLGWHPQFPYAAVGDWIAAQPDAELVERRALAPLRLFTLLRVRKTANHGT